MFSLEIEGNLPNQKLTTRAVVFAGFSKKTAPSNSKTCMKKISTEELNFGYATGHIIITLELG